MNVVAFLSDHLLSTLRAVLREDHRIFTPLAVEALAAAIQQAHADVLVVEPSAVPSPQWPALLGLLRQEGMPAVVVYTTISPPAMRATVELARLGIRHIVLKGYDDSPRHFRALFDALASDFWASVLYQRLRPDWQELPLPVLDALAFLFRFPDRVRTVADLAAAAGVTTRTLHRWLGRVGVASAKRLVLAARVEWAHTLLRTGRLQVREVADRLGYVSPRQFRREVHLLTGLTPATLSRRWPADELVELLATRLATHGSTRSAAAPRQRKGGAR
ncbi:MAG TPA: helix-turn-helix transcriptional regulator [Gemmatimonadaceae bacterium]|nr:helix-turn-helix transcriptional regulator [Gemmatimonadaceae bacterium]